MNLSKSIMAAVLGLSVVSVSHAGTVFVSGSTAMRSIFYAACTNAGTVFTAQPTVTTWEGNGTDVKAANYMAFSGTLVGGSGTTVINCHWSGSEGGISDVATGASQNFLPAFDGTDHGTTSPGAGILAPATVQLAMADNAQSFSRTKTPVITAATEVGVITFKWVRNNGLWTGNNVTDSQIRNALSGGAARALFDGVAGHSDFVYVSGRDNQSGTRVNAFGDSGYGIFTAPFQIELDGAGNMVDQGGGTYIGDFGFSSGGSLANSFAGSSASTTDQVNGGTGFSVIAYLSVGDAATAIAKGGTELAYDGVTFSPAAVEEGQYTFWGNEYLLKNNSVTSGEAQTVYNKLSPSATGISAFCDGTKAIKLSAMNCTRGGPTSDPSHN